MQRVAELSPRRAFCIAPEGDFIYRVQVPQQKELFHDARTSSGRQGHVPLVVVTATGRWKDARWVPPHVRQGTSLQGQGQCF